MSHIVLLPMMTSDSAGGSGFVFISWVDVFAADCILVGGNRFNWLGGDWWLVH